MGRTIGNPCLLLSDCKESPWHVGQVSSQLLLEKWDCKTEAGSMVFVRYVLKDVVGILNFQKAWTAFMCHNSAKLLKAQIHTTVTEEAPCDLFSGSAFLTCTFSKKVTLMLVCKISQNKNFWGFFPFRSQKIQVMSQLLW